MRLLYKPKIYLFNEMMYIFDATRVLQVIYALSAVAKSTNVIIKYENRHVTSCVCECVRR